MTKNKKQTKTAMKLVKANRKLVKLTQERVKARAVAQAVKPTIHKEVQKEVRVQTRRRNGPTAQASVVKHFAQPKDYKMKHEFVTDVIEDAIHTIWNKNDIQTDDSIFLTENVKVCVNTADVFPSASTIAQMYEMWEIEECTFIFRPFTDFTTSGVFMLCYDPDGERQGYQSYEQMSNSRYFATSRLSDNRQCTLKLHKEAFKNMFGSGKRECGNMNVEDNSEYNVSTDNGRLYFAVAGIQSQVGKVGELFCKYRIRFSKKRWVQTPANFMRKWTSTVLTNLGNMLVPGHIELKNGALPVSVKIEDWRDTLSGGLTVPTFRIEQVGKFFVNFTVYEENGGLPLALQLDCHGISSKHGNSTIPATISDQTSDMCRTTAVNSFHMSMKFLVDIVTPGQGFLIFDRNSPMSMYRAGFTNAQIWIIPYQWTGNPSQPYFTTVRREAEIQREETKIMKEKYNKLEAKLKESTSLLTYLVKKFNLNVSEEEEEPQSSSTPSPSTPTILRNFNAMHLGAKMNGM